MLKITVPATEQWDAINEKFVFIDKQELTLEHSLISLAKWERTWCKPFLSNKEKTHEETIDYIKCMTLTPNVKPEVYEGLSDENVKAISDYIHAPMTATTFSNQKKGSKVGEQVTAELIYYWMISLNIPHEYEKWHLNSLLTLIQVCSIKNQPDKKMGKKALASQNAALNAARRKQFNSKG